MKLSLSFASICRKYKFTSSLWKTKKTILCFSPNRVLFHNVNQCSVLTVSASTLYASFHCCTPLFAKQFQERENEYAHNIMSNIDSYCNSVLKYPLTLKNGPLNSSSTEISQVQELSDFSKVTEQAVLKDLSLEDEKFTQLIRDLVYKLPAISDEQLIQIIHYLCLWKPSPKSYSPNFKMLWNALDFECVQRINNWNLDRKLLVADYWFYLKLNRISQYNRTLISDLLRNLKLLSNSQVVQLMFCINLQRKVSQDQMGYIEEKLASVLKLITVEEIGIVCLGFFKTENKITDFNTIRLIIDRFNKALAEVNKVTVVAILKFLKKSLHLNSVDYYIPLLHKCIPYVPKWDVLAAVHLALLATECHVYHPLLLNTVTEKLADEIEIARIKDCTKLLQCLSHFNHFPESKFHKLFALEIFKKSRQTEIEHHPEILPYAVLYYAYLGHYDHSIIRAVMAPKFRNYCKQINPQSANSFAEIDYCVGIECTDYSGPRLHKEELKVLNKRRGNMPGESQNNNTLVRVMVEITDTLEEILNGKENILIRHILPHIFSPDVIVRLTCSPEPLPSLYKNFPSDSVLYPPKDEIWACFVINPAFSLAYQSRHLTGNTKMKIRQLEKIGYKVLFCPSSDVPLSSTMRKKYLKEKLDILRNSCESTEKEGESHSHHLIFVYGTLKRNEPNHDLVTDSSKGKAIFEAMARTVQKFPLVIASRYNIPYLLYKEGVGKHVIGELYKVDDAMLERMDELECNGKYYNRIKVEVQPFIPDDENRVLPIVKPWIYFLMNYREHLLDLPHLENYSSKGPHGLEYVSSEDTSDPEQIYE
ncbi:Gamma-glutamylaminecyclotransferase like protein [Argiope bruennichi]|uniref:Gamma-glutamylaminecyclotransferase like protein n=1 Tax=Argiope bruennichi TaxID=94029 RepID=A0A8T0G234_ARGBR|nr:Gamma-glutamylaminecyclotransferase like protein [Argiope bruennichi]